MMKLRELKVALMGMAVVLGLMLAMSACGQEDSPGSQTGEESMDDRPEHHGRPGDENDDRPMRRDERGPQRGQRGQRGMGRGHGPDGDNSRGGEQMIGHMSKEDIAKMMLVLQDYNPQLAETLEQGRDRNPREFMRMVRRAAPKMRRLMYLPMRLHRWPSSPAAPACA